MRLTGLALICALAAVPAPSRGEGAVAREPAREAGTAPDPGAPGLARVGLLPPVVGAAERMAGDPRSGFALGGFDPVSFFLGPEPRPGRPDLEVLWGGVAWRFAGEANREAFRRAPEAYAPRLGGHDALAMAEGRLVTARPLVHHLAGGRLYLFRSPAARDRFAADPGLARAAEARWLDLGARVIQP